MQAFCNTCSDFHIKKTALYIMSIETTNDVNESYPIAMINHGKITMIS